MEEGGGGEVLWGHGGRERWSQYSGMCLGKPGLTQPRWLGGNPWLRESGGTPFNTSSSLPPYSLSLYIFITLFFSLWFASSFESVCLCLWPLTRSQCVCHKNIIQPGRHSEGEQAEDSRNHCSTLLSDWGLSVMFQGMPSWEAEIWLFHLSRSLNPWKTHFSLTTAVGVRIISQCNASVWAFFCFVFGDCGHASQPFLCPIPLSSGSRVLLV